MKHTLTATLVCALACSFGTKHSARAAEFTARDTPSGPIVTIAGTIEFGDETKFNAMPAKAGTVIHLISRGGNTITSLKIGLLVRQTGWDTYVPPDETCASACGNIWIAGNHRMLGEGARVGWHQAVCLAATGCYNAVTAQINHIQSIYWQQMTMPDYLRTKAMTETPNHMLWVMKTHGHMGFKED